MSSLSTGNVRGQLSISTNYATNGQSVAQTFPRTETTASHDQANEQPPQNSDKIINGLVKHGHFDTDPLKRIVKVEKRILGQTIQLDLNGERIDFKVEQGAKMPFVIDGEIKLLKVELFDDEETKEYYELFQKFLKASQAMCVVAKTATAAEAHAKIHATITENDRLKMQEVRRNLADNEKKLTTNVTQRAANADQRAANATQRAANNNQIAANTEAMRALEAKKRDNEMKMAALRVIMEKQPQQMTLPAPRPPEAQAKVHATELEKARFQAKEMKGNLATIQEQRQALELQRRENEAKKLQLQMKMDALKAEMAKREASQTTSTNSSTK